MVVVVVVVVAVVVVVVVTGAVMITTDQRVRTGGGTGNYAGLRCSHRQKSNWKVLSTSFSFSYERVLTGDQHPAGRRRGT